MEIDSTLVSLTDLLTAKLGSYSEADPAWVQYVKDHRSYLLQNSYTQYMTKADAWTYRYRPEEYLASINYDTSCTWLMLWLNQLTPALFIGLDSFFLPDHRILADVYAMYTNCQFAAAKALE